MVALLTHGVGMFKQSYEQGVFHGRCKRQVRPGEGPLQQSVLNDADGFEGMLQ